MPRTLACLLLLVFATGGAFAQAGGVYKWKDAKGVTHYTDTPPPGSRYASVQANAAARRAPPAKVDPRCAVARSNVERLNSGNADIGLDANRDGKPDASLAPAMRADQLRMAEAALRNFCPQPTP
ncbi:MAG: DUF4124 domain-containing protein [Pseudomonadota bacterium]